MSLGFADIIAPLGMVMLVFTAAISGLLIVYIVLLQAGVILEARRLTKEVKAQRELADTAEASRFTELLTLLESELRRIEAQGAASNRDFGARMEQSERGMEQKLAERRVRCRPILAKSMTSSIACCSRGTHWAWHRKQSGDRFWEVRRRRAVRLSEPPAQWSGFGRLSNAPMLSGPAIQGCRQRGAMDKAIRQRLTWQIGLTIASPPDWEVMTETVPKSSHGARSGFFVGSCALGSKQWRGIWR